MIVQNVTQLNAKDFREMALSFINAKLDSFVAYVYEEIYIKSQEGALAHIVDVSDIDKSVLDKFIEDLKQKGFGFIFDTDTKTIEIKW